VTFSDDEFDFVYDVFELLMSPFANNERLADALRGENDVWKILKEKQEARRTAGACGERPELEGSQIP
jgi:hypothetical protein